MGFSVSGAAAIIFASMFIAFGAWYGAASNGFEQVNEARELQADDIRETRNTHVSISSATYDAGAGQLTVVVDNTGGSQLTLNGTDLLVDGQYVDGWQGDATVEGDGATDLWLVGEELTITVARSSQPDRVKVVADTGVSNTSEVV